MLRDLNANVLVNVQRAWRENYPTLLEKHRQRLFEPIKQQEDLTEAVRMAASKPANQFTVYPQAGSTANLGCQMQSPEFKVIPPSAEQQPQLESRKNNEETPNGQ